MTDQISNRQAYGQALLSLGAVNPRVVVLEADLGKSTGTYLFGQEYPDRYIEMGIAEGNMISASAGLAAAGRIPYASTFCMFAALRAAEQVRNSVAYPCLNVKIVATNGGIEVGADGVTHQAIEDIAIMRAIANMTVLVPSDPVMTARLVHMAAEYDGPLYIRLGRQPTPVLYSDDTEVTIGSAVALRGGDDVTLMAIGNMVCRSLAAANLLATQGISARVLDMYSVKPLDTDAIVKAAKETGCIVTAEDHSIVGGLGSAVAEVLADYRPVPLERVGIRDRFAQSGNWEQLLTYYGLTPAKIAKAAVRAIARREGQS